MATYTFQASQMKQAQLPSKFPGISGANSRAGPQLHTVSRRPDIIYLTDDDGRIFCQAKGDGDFQFSDKSPLSNNQVCERKSQRTLRMNG
jgi:hypothetical protein